MSTYLSRPVFEFPINWAESVSKEFSYDSREVMLGYSSPRTAPLQTHTIHGYEFAVLLSSEQVIADFEAFTAARQGRLNGFWFPSPLDAFKIVEGVSATEFIIQNQGLRFSLNGTASLYLRFTKAGWSPQHAKISAVEDDRQGHERVTLTAALDFAVDSTWDANKLVYVRMANDTEEATSPADNVEVRKLKVIELPDEYVSTETGQLPVYLYQFSHDSVGPVWRFTGLNQDIVSSGQTFTTFAIEHKDHTRSIENDQDQLSILSFYDSANPMAQFLPFRMGRQLKVKVLETGYGAPDTTTVVFDGYCVEADVKGRLLTVKCQSFLDVLGRNFPAFFIQPRCNYFLYSTTCGMDPAPFTLTAAITAVSGRFLTLQPGSPPDWFETLKGSWFAGGYLETGSKTDTSYQARGIVNSSYRVGAKFQVELSAPLTGAIVGQSVTVTAGCDGTAATCRSKFKNFRRWGGHVLAPQNLSVKAMEAETANGNKK